MIYLNLSILTNLLFLCTSIIFAQSETIAKTAQGSYQGHLINNIVIWYGIPYAQQPIKELRWKPPQKLGVTQLSQVIQA